MCDDSGIAVGAALAVHHNILGHPLPDSRPAWSSPYLGPIHPYGEVIEAFTAAGDAINVERCKDAADQAAQDLAESKIVAWYEGGSEAGPRALGHRSLLADPRDKDMWDRVNQVKGREAWRPLAPVVLEEHAADWFSGVALPSPYMLFNADVRSVGISAVTHVDGTARIQTVNDSSGDYFKLVSGFHQRTGVPVLLNTSLNSPGEPIVESPAEAVGFLLRSRVDVLYLSGHRVTRSIERD